MVLLNNTRWSNYLIVIRERILGELVGRSEQAIEKWRQSRLHIHLPNLSFLPGGGGCSC